MASESDDYNSVARYEAYAERLRSAGRNGRLTEYPTAAHAFDNPVASLTPSVVKNAQMVRSCTIREETTGQRISAATAQLFTYKDSCVERDTHVGYDLAATQAEKQAVRDLLRAVFKLD